MLLEIATYMEPLLIKFISKTVHLTTKVEIKQYKANKITIAKKKKYFYIYRGDNLHWFIDEKQVLRNVSDV